MRGPAAVPGGRGRQALHQPELPAGRQGDLLHQGRLRLLWPRVPVVHPAPGWDLVQYNTVQYSTVQYSIVQYSTDGTPGRRLSSSSSAFNLKIIWGNDGHGQFNFEMGHMHLIYQKKGLQGKSGVADFDF